MYYLEDQVFGVTSRVVETREEIEPAMRAMLAEGLAKDDQDGADAMSVECMTAYICVMVPCGEGYDCGCRDYREWHEAQPK